MRDFTDKFIKIRSIALKFQALSAAKFHGTHGYRGRRNGTDRQDGHVSAVQKRRRNLKFI